MMRASTHFRLFLAQIIMMLSFVLFGAVEARDHHWPNWSVWVVAAIGAGLGFLIPTKDEAYRITSGMSSRQYWLLRFLRGKRQAEFSRWLTPPDKHEPHS